MMRKSSSMFPGKCSVLGYDAAFAREGAAAIELYAQEKKAGRPFDLVIIDLTIPEGMGGRETIEKLRQYDPKVKAVVSSGYTNDPVMQDFASLRFFRQAYQTLPDKRDENPA